MAHIRQKHAVGEAIHHFFLGMAHIFDFAGVLHPKSTTTKSDAEALRSDWEAIGQDFRSVIGDWEDFPEDHENSEMKKPFKEEKDE